MQSGGKALSQAGDAVRGLGSFGKFVSPAMYYGSKTMGNTADRLGRGMQSVCRLVGGGIEAGAAMPQRVSNAVQGAAQGAQQGFNYNRPIG